MITISRQALTIGSFSVHWYGILIALGIWGGLTIAMRREKRCGLPAETVLSLGLWAIPAAIVGARLYFVAFSWDAFRGDLLSIFNLRGGGMAIYGGVLGGAAAGLIFARCRRLSVPALADAAAPALAFGQAVGRWGNFLNQEAYGAAVLDPRWQFFPAAVYIEAKGGWFAAAFFYESVWCLMICALILLWEKWRPGKAPGLNALAYLVLYGAERVLVEGLRLDSLYAGPVRVSQLLSALALSACALYLALTWKRPAARRISLPVTALGAAGLVACCLVPTLPRALLPVCCAAATVPALWALFSRSAPHTAGGISE